MDIHREKADKYQGLFNLMNNEHGLILTITEMDEIIIEAQKVVNKNFDLADVRKSSPLVEGNTKSNVKNNTQTRRLASPPPPIKR